MQEPSIFSYLRFKASQYSYNWTLDPRLVLVEIRKGGSCLKGAGSRKHSGFEKTQSPKGEGVDISDTTRYKDHEGLLKEGRAVMDFE